MIDFMKRLPTLIKKPDAIVVISAHWEENEVTVLGSSNPDLFYDYYGFPDEAYNINYPAPGNSKLASRILNLFEKSEIKGCLNVERGFDHGLYIPLMLMYPKADIPSIQISLVHSLNPFTHIEIGNALRELMNENILIIGSGFSFHNMKEFIWDRNNKEDLSNNSFQDWLIKTCTSPMPLSERLKLLSHWEDAPSARYCHPREEHLLPLHVCTGIAGENMYATKIFDDNILGKRSVAFQW
ncbi:MAG: dioxygenase [Desulfobacterales bacterium]|nr:dioxygenase [Desulfobacterales bacterium]